MTKIAKEFVHDFTERLDALLGSLTQDDKHDLLDSLAAEIEERLDQVMDSEEA